MNIRFADTPISSVTADLLVVGVDKSLDALASIDELLDGQLISWLGERKFEAGAGDAVVIPSFGRFPSSQLAVVGLGNGSLADLAKAAGKAGHLAREQKAPSTAVHFGALDAAQAQHVVEFLFVGAYRFDSYLPEDQRKPAVKGITILGAGTDASLTAAAAKASARAKYQAFARDLVNMPPADLYPESLADHAKTLGVLDHVTVEVWDFERCREEGLVGIIAVGQGSSRPGCLIHLRYTPPDAKDHIALVGKGVTFDAGGLSLKPSNYMQTMRCDMGGAACALGAFGAIAATGVPVAVDAFVPSVENMCGGNSFKLGDILKYRNGVTVEIHNTDAEGRLILADALTLACEVEGVSRVVDMATLTGAVVVALGPDYTGLFTHDDELAGELQAASDAASELVWRMPLHSPYKRLLKGTWGQIKNVGNRDAGSVTAALFLGHFVTDEVKWAHLDVAGTAFIDAAVPPYISGATGQMVRSLTNWAESLAS